MAMVSGFDSPEAAATVGFPPKYCRVVATRVEGDDAVVLLDAGSPGRLYLYEVKCRRRDGRWFGGASGNGPGWSSIDEEGHLGTTSIWGEAPADADMVRTELNGEFQEEEVVSRTFLSVWWRQPYPAYPTVIAFRIRGVWVDAE